MEKLELDAVQTFDSRYTNNQIQIMKVMLPFLEPAMRRTMTVMIRFLEFQHTLKLVQSQPKYFETEALPFSLDTCLDSFKKYCPPQFISMLENFQSMQSAMKMYEEMKGMMDLFGDVTAAEASPPEGNSAPSSGQSPFSGMNLMNLLSPEQMEMFRMFQSDMNGSADFSSP